MTEEVKKLTVTIDDEEVVVDEQPEPFRKGVQALNETLTKIEQMEMELFIYRSAADRIRAALIDFYRKQKEEAQASEEQPSE
jgi:hypothetical protein